MDIYKVTENLYRFDSPSGYYAPITKSGKQFRRSLNTKDQKLADLWLKELKQQIGGLSLIEDAKLSLEILANRWLESNKPRFVNRSIVIWQHK